MIRIGVLGASSIARRRTLPAMLGNARTTLVAVASNEPAKAARFAELFGCDHESDYRAILKRDDVEAVYLPLPAAVHHRWAAEALEAGKHVLVEKPATTTTAELADLITMADRRGLVLRDNLTSVHHRLHRTIFDLVRAGRIGEPRFFQGWFCIPPLPATDIRYRPDLGGGALLDLAVYPLTAARNVLGEDLKLLGASLRVDDRTGVDVGGSALLSTPGGETATVTFGFEHGYGSRYLLWGSTGRISCDRVFTPPGSLAVAVRIEEQDHVEELTLPPDDQFGNCLTDFAEAVDAARRTGTDPGVAAWRARATAISTLIDRIRADAEHVRVCAGAGRS